MQLKNVNINAALASIKQLLVEEKSLSPAFRAAIELLVLIVTLLSNRLGLDSTNSSKPPSTDPHRKRKEKKPGDKKPGGQPGHIGATLKRVEKPDVVKKIKIDRRSLPRNMKYKEVGCEWRQVIDIEFKTVVTEYQAQVLEDENGKRYTAPFPADVTRPIQYGAKLKAHAVYLSQFQLIPYQRTQDHFSDQLGIDLSTGSLCTFNVQAYELLERFDEIGANKLAESPLMNADETGVNINGKRIWLHTASNDKWTQFRVHAKRGTIATNEIGIIPRFKGILVHDHHKPYFTYSCLHALCNAHHLRELERAWEQDHFTWAQRMQALLNEINIAVQAAGGQLTFDAAEDYKRVYRKILAEAEVECPPPDKALHVGKRGRQKRSKARNLLERLMNFETEVLRFMENPLVPFTNNLAENDLRMTKVQQKISGCFRSLEGAHIFCRIRGYLITCRKHGIGPSEALKILFRGELPAFCFEKC